MDLEALRQASADEHAHYVALLAAYRRLLADATDTAARRAAESATESLREIAAVLVPYRVADAALPADVHARWRESAALAAEAVRTNAALVRTVRARQAALRERLATLATGRRGLAGYRPGTQPHAAVSRSA
jgi:hypothetical protein